MKKHEVFLILPLSIHRQLTGQIITNSIVKFSRHWIVYISISYEEGKSTGKGFHVADDSRELKQTTTVTATRTSQNKRFK